MTAKAINVNRATTEASTQCKGNHQVLPKKNDQDRERPEMVVPRAQALTLVQHGSSNRNRGNKAPCGCHEHGMSSVVRSAGKSKREQMEEKKKQKKRTTNKYAVQTLHLL